jgi:hypothetical protein
MPLRHVLRIEEPIMLGRPDVDVELKRSLGLTIKELRPLLAAGGDLAEKKFMECCWCLWKVYIAQDIEMKKATEPVPIERPAPRN